MNKFSATLKGFIIGLTIILISLANFYLLKLPYNGNIQYVCYLIYLLGILWTLESARKSNPAFTFKNYFSTGFKSFIIVSLLMSSYAYFFQRLNPQILETFIQDNNQQIIATKTKTSAEIAENEKTLRNIYLPMILSFAAISYLALGALITTVIGGFMSSRNNEKIKVS